MTDYLAEIAARTVECSNLDCKGTGYITKYGGYDGTVPTETLCAVCMNTGRVLDPRFEGLRKPCPASVHPNLNKVHDHTKQADCQGYTVNRDLAMLLVCLDTSVSIAHNQGRGWTVDVFAKGPYHGTGRADTPLKAVAKAVYEWLEADKKVTP